MYLVTETQNPLRRVSLAKYCMAIEVYNSSISNQLWYTDKCRISTTGTAVTYQVYATALGTATAAGNIYSSNESVGANETKYIYVGVGNYLTITGSGFTAVAIGTATSAQAGSGNFTEQFIAPPAPASTPGSAQFSGTNYLDVASTAAFGFGTADLTIEFWWRPTVNQRSDVLDFWSTPGGGSYPVTRFDFGRVASTTLDLYTDGTGGSGAKITGPTLASLLNAWHHMAITRQSGSIKMWVDGTQRGSTYSANVLNMGADMQLRIMGDHGAAGNGSGNLSNIRVVRGVAVYTGAFTPPVAPLTVTQGAGTNISAITAGQTQMLLNTDSGANFLVDSSTNAITVTNTGAVTSSALNPF